MPIVSSPSSHSEKSLPYTQLGMASASALQEKELGVDPAGVSHRAHEEWANDE